MDQNIKLKSGFSIIFCCMLMVFLTKSTYGQANPEKHAEGIKKIAFFKGTWGSTTYTRDKEGNFLVKDVVSANDPDSTKLTTFKPIFGENYYQIKAKVGFNFSMTIGYDQWRDKYVMVSFEDGPGLIDIYQGDFDEEGNLSLNNFEAGTHYVQKGVKYYNRMVFANITDSGFTWFIDISTDGVEWNRVNRYDLKK